MLRPLLALSRLRSAVDNPSREVSAAAPAAPPAVAIRDVHKSFRLPHQQYMTLKERALHPFRSRTFDELHAVDDVSLDVERGRVLRHRRPQRLGQEHAAQVPRGHLPDRQRRRDRARSPRAVHRARRRLQPRAHRAGQRRDQRDHAGAHAPAGEGALRRHHRVRRARGVRGPQAQELLVRHVRPPRVLDRDPGRRRHPPRRRGARRRRRRLPAEVLRHVHVAQGFRAHGRLRHPRHARRRALLRPRDAHRARARAVDRGPVRDRARLQRAQLRPRPARGRRAHRPGPRCGRDPRLLVRDLWRRDRHVARAGRAAGDLHGRPVPRPARAARSSRSACATRSGTRSSRPRRGGRAPPPATSPAATRCASGSSSRTGSRRAAIRRHPPSRGRTPTTRPSTYERIWRR